jgi:mannose-6-phosphate isomerase
MNATRLRRLEGVVRSYAWGSRTAIPELLGQAPSAEPQAELWLGAHPSAPSLLRAGDEGEVPLDAWIRRDPEAALGARMAERFGGELPFLLKLLAAAEPLSIQAHPSEEQARAGFARENAAGVPLDAPHRSYRDPHPKPELICAVTPFRALNRFREPDEIAVGIEALGVDGLRPLLEPLREAPDRSGLRAFFEAWMTLEPEAGAQLVGRAAEAAAGLGDDPARAEVVRLAKVCPGDPGVLAPLFLNLVELAPGEAMFLPAGELHSYLGGLGVELMAASDNVLRGGLTPKHVDVPELIRTLGFGAGPVEVLRPERISATEAGYETPAEEFSLSVIDVTPSLAHESGARSGVEILLCTSGETRVHDLQGGSVVGLPRGAAVWVPAGAGAYRVECAEGEGRVYRARVP